MLDAIAYNFRHVFDFSGRDARPTFWYWILFLIGLQFLIGMVVSVPLYLEMFSGAFDAARSGASDEQIRATVFSEMSGQLKTQMGLSLATGAVMSALFAASFVRRLHDSGKPGWILALVLVPYLGALLYNFVNFDAMLALVESSMAGGDPEAALANQSRLYTYSAFAWLGYIVAIVFGVMKSDAGPNPYGETSVRF